MRTIDRSGNLTGDPSWPSDLWFNSRSLGWLLAIVIAIASVPVIAQQMPRTAGTDLSGEWAPRFHEDQPERIPGPDIGDYLGLPINDGGAGCTPTVGTPRC